jgi:tetratricopeptide (TPR) repeat protein
VLPFEDASADRSQGAGDAAATPQRFGEAIEALPRLRVIDGSSLLEAGQSWRAIPLADLLGRARRLGGRYLVTGGISRNGGMPHVTIDVFASSDGEQVARSSVPAQSEGLRRAMGRVALDAIRRIAERDSLALGVQEPLLSSTSSAFALRHLIDGQRKFWRSDFDGAVTAFQSAIAEDSACALAYHRLSVAEIWRHDFPRALAAAEAGLKRHPSASRWSELLEGQRHYARRDGRNSIEAFQQSVRDDPANIDGWLGLGEALFHLGWFAGHAPSDATLALRRVMTLDSTFAPIPHHLVDLAVYRDDAREARRWLRAFPPNDPQQPSRVALVALRFGSEKERADALHQLAEAERYTISHLVAVLMNGSFDVQLADTVAAYLAGAGRTPEDRLRGAQYRLVTRAALGRWEDGLSAWQAAWPGSNLDGWLVQAYFAGRPVQDIVAPIFAEARRRVATGGGPNFTLPVWHDDQQAFLALAHRGLVEGSVQEVRDLLKRLASAAPQADPSDPLPSSLESSLEARLAVLRGDTTRAVALLEQSVARISEPFTPFFPLTAMAPQRLLLARLLAARHDTRAASRWLDSFYRSPSVADAFFADTVGRIAERYGHRPDRGR